MSVASTFSERAAAELKDHIARRVEQPHGSTAAVPATDGRYGSGCAEPRT